MALLTGGSPKSSTTQPSSETSYDPKSNLSSFVDRMALLTGQPQNEKKNDDYKSSNVTPSSYDDTDIKDRLSALESRNSIIQQPTQDLSGITERLSELEGRKPQDLSGITGRLSELEGKKADTSWKDPLSLVQLEQEKGGKDRADLGTRLASLENYYKNDPPPPPDESTGNRYEDKQAALNKMWEQTGNVYDPEAFDPNNPWTNTKDETPSWFGEDRKGDYVRNKDWTSAQQFANALPETYRKQMRDLDKEYNKPSHSAIIKGREYTAYGPAQKARLEMLDKQNIHEDEYLGHGTWENKFGEEVTGQGRSTGSKRYFASHSGLDPESEEYAKRFRRQDIYYTDDGKATNLYKMSQSDTLGNNLVHWNAQGGYKPEKHGKYGWGVVGTNKSKTGKNKWDEAYYPEIR